MFSHLVTNDFFRKRVVIYKFLNLFKSFSAFNSPFSKYVNYNFQKSLILPSKFVPVDQKNNYLCDRRSLDTIAKDFNNHYANNKRVLAELKNDFSFEPIGNIDFVISKSNFVTSIPPHSFKPLIKDERSFELLQQQCHQHLDTHKFVLVQLKTGKEVDPKLSRYDYVNYQDFDVVKTEAGECLSNLDAKDNFIADLVSHSKNAASFDLNSAKVDIMDPLSDVVIFTSEVTHKSSPHIWKPYSNNEYVLTNQNILDNFIELIQIQRDNLVLSPNSFKERSYNFINKILDDAECDLYSKEEIFVTFDETVNELYNFSFFQRNCSHIFQQNYSHNMPTRVAFEDVDLSLIKQKYQELLNGVYSNTSASELLENFTTLCFSDSDLQIFFNLAEVALTHEFMLPLLLPHFILTITPSAPFSGWYCTATVYTSYFSLCEFGSIKEVFSFFRR